MSCGFDPRPGFGEHGQPIERGVVEIVGARLAIRGRGDQDLLARVARAAIEAIDGARQERVDALLELFHAGVEPVGGARVGEVADAEHRALGVLDQPPIEIVALGREQRRLLGDAPRHVDPHQRRGLVRIVGGRGRIQPVVGVDVDRAEIVIDQGIGFGRLDPGVVDMGLPVQRRLALPLGRHGAGPGMVVERPVERVRGRALGQVMGLTGARVHAQQSDAVHLSGVREDVARDDDVVRPVAQYRIQQMVGVEGARPVVTGVVLAYQRARRRVAIRGHREQTAAAPGRQRAALAIDDAVDQAFIVDPGDLVDIGARIGHDDPEFLEVAAVEDGQLHTTIGRRNQGRQPLARRRQLHLREIGDLEEIRDRDARGLGGARAVGGTRQDAERQQAGGHPPEGGRNETTRQDAGHHQTPATENRELWMTLEMGRAGLHR